MPAHSVPTVAPIELISAREVVMPRSALPRSSPPAMQSLMPKVGDPAAAPIRTDVGQPTIDAQAGYADIRRRWPQRELMPSLLMPAAAPFNNRRTQ